jgi:hypothetical protein
VSFGRRDPVRTLASGRLAPPPPRVRAIAFTFSAVLGAVLSLFFGLTGMWVECGLGAVVTVGSAAFARRALVRSQRDSMGER